MSFVIVIFKGSLYRQLKTVCYVIVFDVLQLFCTTSLALLSYVCL